MTAESKPEITGNNESRHPSYVDYKGSYRIGVPRQVVAPLEGSARVVTPSEQLTQITTNNAENQNNGAESRVKQDWPNNWGPRKVVHM